MGQLLGKYSRKNEKRCGLQKSEEKTVKEALNNGSDMMDIQRRQLTRTEKYELFVAFRDKTENEVILFMKDSPWAFSSIFWFETLGQSTVKGEKHTGCSCSRDYELGMKNNVTTDEMLTRLELCVRYGMCFHVILQKAGISVTYDKDISVDEISEHCQNIQENNPTRNEEKCTAGIYWIHLAILFGKEIIIRELLTFYKSLSLPSPTDFLVSAKHKISPVLLAVLQKRSSIAKYIGIIYPSLIYYEALDVDALNTKYVSKEDTKVNALLAALTTHQYEDFNTLYDLLEEPSRETIGEVSSAWLVEMEHAINSGNEEQICDLIKFKGMSIDDYYLLFCFIGRAGSAFGYRVILDEFCQQFMSRKKDKNEEEYKKTNRQSILDKIMIRIVFFDDASVVRLFVDHGFHVNAKFCELSLLTWAEVLNLPDISNILSSSGATKTEPNITKSFVELVLEQTRSSVYAKYAQFNDIENLHIIHKLFENGHGSVSDNIIDKAFDQGRYLIVKYLLMRGADPHSALFKSFWVWKLLFLIVVTNTPFTNFEDLIGEKGEFSSLYSNFDILQALPEIVHKSSIQDMVSTQTMEWMKSNLIPKTPTYVKVPWFNNVRPLQNICRSRLSSHFEGYKYLRYLKLIEESVPKTLFTFLKKEDILQKFLAASQRREFERLFAGVDTFFL